MRGIIVGRWFDASAEIFPGRTFPCRDELGMKQNSSIQQQDPGFRLVQPNGRSRTLRAPSGCFRLVGRFFVSPWVRRD